MPWGARSDFIPRPGLLDARSKRQSEVIDFIHCRSAETRECATQRWLFAMRRNSDNPN
jgi:hypothetical protein